MSRSLLAFFMATLLLPFGVATAADDTQSVVADVLRMLGEDVSSGVILDWLDGRDAVVGALDPDDMIALTRAGASDELVRKLLDMSEASTETPPAPAARTQEPSEDGPAEVAISLRYRAYVGEEDHLRRWDLFVYMDGEPLIWSANTGSLTRSRVEATRRLEPGKYVLRLTRENHASRKKGWRHESFASPEVIEFEIGPGDGWQLELDWVEPAFSMKKKGPLTWALSRWGKHVVGEKGIGENKESWPRICEDIEASIPEGKEMPGWARRELKGCVRWAELWAEGPDVSTRADLLTELAEHDFRPPRGTTPGGEPGSIRE